MTFKKATDLLMEQGVTLAEMAQALGAVHGMVRFARMNPEAGSYRRPPANWQPKLAKLARERSSALAKIADRLEP